jgi:3',5'-cyclic AMP phosphodiesterase CpdA
VPRIVPALVLACLLLACRRPAPDVPAAIDPIRVELPTARIIIYGDSRPAVTGEQFFMGRTDPEAERALVIERIAFERPDLIIHSGDLVTRGGNEEHWKNFDLTHKAIFDAKIPFHATLGNHEYLGEESDRLRHLHARFPERKGCRWYAVRAGPILFAMLDTNFDELPKSFVESQDAWFGKLLRDAASDEGVKALIVVAHHPPYTNSKTHGPSEETRRRFSDTAATCPKFRMFVAGHVHNYERFDIKGVPYVVSGGGGAPQTGVRTSEFRTEPAFKGPEYRPFHYLLMTVGDAGASVATVMLQDDATWKTGDRFELSW